MAYLLNLNSNSRCYLNPYHSFGRLQYAVDTVVSGAKISKHHAIIEWQDDCWQIRDLSRNGTWVNATKLNKSNPHRLTCQDKIYFAEPDCCTFLVENLSAPCDLLIPSQADATNSTNIPEPIELNNYHFLPDEQKPQWVIFKGSDQQQWFIERLDRQNEPPVAFNDNDTIEFSSLCWQLKLNHHAQTTELLSSPPLTLDQLNFIFDLSLDEETTHLRVQGLEDNIDLLVRSHHYLTLNLARYRAADALVGLDEQHQGWVTTDRLMRDLGIDYSHLNIQIHRARKQLVDALNICDDQSFISRQGGKLRFGASQFKIIKGQEIECEQQTGDGSAN